MSKQGVSDGGLRVGVKGGGCSGLSYTFMWERQARAGDEVFEAFGALTDITSQAIELLLR